MALKQVAGRTQCKIVAKASPRPAQATKAVAEPKWKQAGLVSAATLLSQVSPALAVDESSVDSTIESLIGAVKATGEAVKTGLTAVEGGVKVLKEGYDVAAPVIQKGVETVAPIVQQATSATAEVVAPALKSLPSLNDAGKVLAETGVDVKAISSTTSTVAATASKAATTVVPFVSKVADVVSQSDPVTLVEAGLAGAVLLYLTPAILGAVGGSLRGFAGEVTAANALDMVASSGDSLLIDIRIQKEKEQSGVPDVPSSISGRLLEVEYAVTEDKKLRGSLRDPNGIEAQITALQIAALKRVSKGAKIILLDRYGPAARTVAKELARKGYSKVFTIQGGFDGRGGWVQSKLQIKPAATVISAPAPLVPKTTTVRKALSAPKA
mmetsp:Transcript_10651/g.22902  ORF Transcript_10651/g.22902 Transcript_10651/m.22902 type:complete len:382 (-) Transcript_10651:495-1640(-)|eukprot:CAMPEP_0202899598 /NCGR_PEP_ID=MMETSP1392-20130828/7784_1 /ASSEMBLY_ACC=CAM_ASM_000868 /TAXON_ID=225041 /ORGANISM="Chlamydomonas chlamydogama, Strain SAG 11-48b" /LENGTH=381 /DNA_ID=CAMNT_0049585821 /DNA_START=53 /DNA_END=1198 /DNA_ORIENTATION=+